jgi:hypothetical protein
MTRKSFVLIVLSMVTLFSAAIAAPSADDVMKKTTAKAQAEHKNIFVHFGAPW